jgi:hypothetical protein
MELFLHYGIIPEKERNRMKFFALGHVGEEGPQIHVLVPKR